MDNPVHPGIPGVEQKQAAWTLWRSGRSKADAPFLDRRRLLTPAAPGGYILTPLFTQMPSRMRQRAFRRVRHACGTRTNSAIRVEIWPTPDARARKCRRRHYTWPEIQAAPGSGADLVTTQCKSSTGARALVDARLTVHFKVRNKPVGRL